MQKRITFRIIAGAGLIMLAAIIFQGCKKEGEDLELSAVPVADFEVVTENANNIILVNKSNVPSTPYWSIDNGEQKYRGDSIKVNLFFAGTYEIEMVPAGQGGIGSSVKKTITITQSDPEACISTKARGFIASCSQKVWKLNPEAGAYKVGPNVDDGTWWASTAGEVTGRPCEFNDTYTFVFNKTGTFTYDNMGDFYGDGYIGITSNTGCQPNSNLSDAQKPWANKDFTYSVSNTGGTAGKGQITVKGVGAHIGLQKARNGSDATPVNPTWTSITYDVIDMIPDGGGTGHDILKLGVNIGSGWWTFTLRSE